MPSPYANCGSVLRHVRTLRGMNGTVAGWGNEVLAWDVATTRGRPLPDGLTLISGIWCGTVSVWDVPGRQKRVRFDWGIGRVEAVAFPPDGQTSAARGADVVIWDNDYR